METLLSAAGRSFLRAFMASLLVLLPGVLGAPDINATRGLALAALLASVVAGIKALQTLKPDLSLVKYLPAPYGNYADSFSRAFVVSFLALITGAFVAPDLATGKSLAVAAVIGSVTAGVRALQALLTKGESPAPAVGL